MNYRFANRLSQLSTSPLRENAKKNLSPQADTISLAYGYPADDSFPIEKLEKISKELYEGTPARFLQYGPTEGLPELRQLLKKRLSDVLNCGSSEDELLITSGSTQAMDLAVKALCNEGDIVLCEEQTFVGAVNAVKSYGAVPVGLPMMGESIDTIKLEEVLAKDTEQRIKMIYLIPTFQNPLGTSMPLEKRKEVYQLAQKYQVIIYEDDPYGDLLYEGETIPKIKTFDTDGLVIYVGSFSKILAPGSRLGFALAPSELLDKMILGKQNSDSHTNFYWQSVATEYIRKYDFEQHILDLRDLYREKFLLMMSCLDKIDPALLNYIRPQGGFFLCCKMGEQIDPQSFYHYLEAKKVFVIPGNMMSVTGIGYEHYFRLNFTNPTEKEIMAGTQIIEEALLQTSCTSKNKLAVNE